MKFRKKPVVIEAFQMTQRCRTDHMCWSEWLHAARGKPTNEEGALWITKDGDLVISTLEGSLTVTPDDWIIQGVQGEIYPCKPDIFEATYERVE